MISALEFRSRGSLERCKKIPGARYIEKRRRRGKRGKPGGAAASVFQLQPREKVWARRGSQEDHVKARYKFLV